MTQTYQTSPYDQGGPVAEVTPAAKFSLVNFDWSTWHTYEWNNWRNADALFGIVLNLDGYQGVWQNSTAYAIDDVTVDPDLYSLWKCLVAHNSAASGTFAEDRTANPTYWQLQVTQIIAYTAADISFDPSSSSLSPGSVNVQLAVDETVGRTDTNAADITQLQNDLTNYLPLSGGAITGNLTVSGNFTSGTTVSGVIEARVAGGDNRGMHMTYSDSFMESYITPRSTSTGVYTDRRLGYDWIADAWQIHTVNLHIVNANLQLRDDGLVHATTNGRCTIYAGGTNLTDGASIRVYGDGHPTEADSILFYSSNGPLCEMGPNEFHVTKKARFEPVGDESANISIRGGTTSEGSISFLDQGNGNTRGLVRLTNDVATRPLQIEHLNSAGSTVDAAVKMSSDGTDVVIGELKEQGQRVYSPNNPQPVPAPYHFIVNFKGDGAVGPATINSSVGVASVNHDATGGLYTITLSSALSNLFPVVQVSGYRDDAFSTMNGPHQAKAVTTTTITLRTAWQGSAGFDMKEVMVVGWDVP